MDVTDLLAQAAAAGASDLHLAEAEPPLLRVYGDLRRLDLPPMPAGQLQQGLAPLLAEHQMQQWLAGAELDLAVTLNQGCRCRLNLFRQRNGLAASLRLIPSHVPSITELGLEDVLQAVAQCTDGLVLIGGATGSGKSSTLAALVDWLNRERSLHIITLEDPIEVIHSSQRSLVTQREVGQHSSDFAQGLRSALRQDPDVIVLGELRDLESIRLALRAAQTGHLVLATVHTRSAVSSIDRMVEVFAADEKPLVRTLLADSLRVVVAQVLVKRRGTGRVAAREVLLANMAVRNLIREGRLAQIYSLMQAGGAAGMKTMDAALQQLRAEGVIETG
ncbi:MAG: PilT/PilU family type 4a pilus ATPase [Pseudomonas sp.]|nr:MAG: PilT/PilU family type 4a pilus ATPase [Pseudomonas sp.]